MNFADYVLPTLNRKTMNFFSIDRINNNGNYEPSNIRWSHPLRQARNRSNTKISMLNALIIADLRKNYGVSGPVLINIFNDELAEDESKKFKKQYNEIYMVSQTYGSLV